MKQKILFLFALFSIATISKAQDTEFWFAAPHPTEQSGLNRPVFIAISNANPFPTDIQITLYNGGGAPVVINETILANGFYKKDFITVSEVAQVQNPRILAGTVTKYGIHITSTLKVSAYYQADRYDSRDIYALKGKKASGSKFYVPMQHDEYGPNQQIYGEACDQIDIVATKDGTEVTVMPTKAIRIGASSYHPANTEFKKTLNKGETLKIMEHVIVGTGGLAGSRSLAGTKITTQDDLHPVAVTVTEDMVKGDTSGDQIVPVNNVSRRYIAPKGSHLASDNQYERIYLVGTVNGTTVTVYDGASNKTYALNEGQSEVYAFNMTTPVPDAVYITSDQPVYCYHRTGRGEQGASLLPSIYAVAQNKVSFFQMGVNAPYQIIVAVFRTGTENDFKITYDGNTSSLSATAVAIPGISEWKCARVNLPAAANNKVISISNDSSPIQICYIFSAGTIDTGTGVFSNFGNFDFGVDVIYKCPDDTHTLFGGYADSYEWQYSPTLSGTYTTVGTGTSLDAVQEGFYSLEMNQNSTIVKDVVEIRNIDFQASIQQTTVTNSGVFTTTYSPSINPALIADPNLDISYQWSFTGGTPATSTDASPVITWTGDKLTAKLTITAEANSSSATGGCTTTVYSYLLLGQDVCPGQTTAITGNFVLPSGGTNSYQWQSSKNSLTWTAIAGATSASFLPPSQKSGITYYRIEVDNGSETVYSDPVCVRVRSCVLPVNHNISVMGYYD